MRPDGPTRRKRIPATKAGGPQVAPTARRFPTILTPLTRCLSTIPTLSLRTFVLFVVVAFDAGH
jgi:hypothetical protein